MGFTIQLDRQQGLGTEEINDVRAEPDLLPELQPCNLPIAEMSPKPLLRLGWIAAGVPKIPCLVAVSSPHPPMLRMGPSLSHKGRGE